MSNSRAADALPDLIAEVYELAGLLRRQGDTIAGQVGQTQARWQILSVVSEGTWTVPDVARRLGISRQAVQRVVDDLSAAERVRLVPNPQHRRSPHIDITARGRVDLADINAASSAWHRGVAADLAPVDVTRATQTLRALIDRIRTDGLP